LAPIAEYISSAVLSFGARIDKPILAPQPLVQDISRRVVDKPRPQRGIDSLTDSELRVAHLVARGLRTAQWRNGFSCLRIW
jgi:hypothetical protein